MKFQLDGLSVRAANVLACSGIRTRKQAQKNLTRIMDVRGCGKETALEILLWCQDGDYWKNHGY